MTGFNRLIIFLLLIALLYALYRYQQNIDKKEDKTSEIVKKEKNIKKDNIELIDEDSIDIDNISKFSIDSEKEDIYKQDSGVESGDTGTYSFLDE